MTADDITPDDMTSENVDQQIRAALAVETTPEQSSQLARLEQFWREQSRAELQRRRRPRAVALVAAVFALVAAWFAFTRLDQPGAPPRETLAEAARPVEAPSAATVEPVALPSPSGGRTPTDFERLVFAARTSAPVDPEQVLLARLRRAASTDETRTLVARLGAVGTRRSVPALLDAAEQPAVRPQAIAAIEQIVGVDRLVDAVRQPSSPPVRAAILARLLAAADPQAPITGFLALVSDPATRGEALAAAAAAKQLPIDALMRSLDAPDKAERLAAAIVLGNVNGPAVSEALIARASQSNRASVETWLALLACRGETVEQFLAQAARRPQMLGQVNNARAYWARMTP